MRKNGKRGVRHLPGTWVIIREWVGLCPEYPYVRVAIEIDKGSGRTRLCLYENSVREVIRDVVHPVHWTTTNERQCAAMAGLVRRAQAAKEGQAHLLHERAMAFKEEHPMVFAFLVDTEYEDGEGRERGMLLCVYENGIFKMCMQDRDQGRSLWVSAQSPTDALIALEDALADQGADWREMKANTAKKGGKPQR